MTFFVFSYPLTIFAVYVTFIFIFGIENIYFSYLFYIVSRKHEVTQLQALFIGFLLLGVSHVLLGIAQIYFQQYGTSETPISMGFTTINLLPLAAALVVSATFIWYATLYFYARIGRSGKLYTWDYIIIGISILGAIWALLPQNLWYQEVPRLAIPNRLNPNPEIHIESIIRLVTGLLMIFVGFATVLAFFALYKKRLRESQDIVLIKRSESLLVGVFLMTFAMSAIVFRDIAYLSSPEVLPTPIMTLIIAMFFQIISALLLYAGILAPEWIVKRWQKSE